MVESVPSAAYVENMMNNGNSTSPHLFDAEHIEQSDIRDMLHYCKALPFFKETY